MLLTLRTTNTYGVTPRAAADAIITALTPAAWYRNATGVTEAGGFASQWDDYSGNSRHLVQATGTNQPAYAAGVFTFDGADNFMNVAGGFTLNQPTTYYIVLKQVSWTSNDRICDGNTINTGGLICNGVSPSVQMYAGAGGATNAGLVVGSFVIAAAVFNGASSSLRANNAAKTTGNPGAGNMGGVYLASSGGGSGQWGNIAVKEFVLFAAAHDDATQDSVITALNNALTVF